MHQKKAFRNIICFLINMEGHRKKRIIKHLFKAVGDRAGPDISERPHSDGELLCRHTLEPVGSILRSMLYNAYQTYKGGTVIRRKNIRASEIKQWCFCPRQWYLLRTTGRKVMTAATKRGVDFHLKESQKVEAVQKTQLAFVATLIIGGIVCCILLLS